MKRWLTMEFSGCVKVAKQLLTRDTTQWPAQAGQPATAGTVKQGSLKTKYPKFPQKMPLYDSNKMEDNFDDKTSTKVQICCPTSNSYMSESKIVTLINFISSYG